MSLLRRRPGFRRLWAAGAVSLCGDWLSFVAVSMLALQGGGGPLALATVFVAHTLPAAVLAPVAGVLIDRFDRRRVLVVVDLLAALVTLAMTAAAAAGWLVTLQVLLLVRSGITAAVPPAESAALRRLVALDELTSANAILSATWSVAYVAGMALGGAAAALGPTLALALDAASFALAAALHATLPPLPVERAAGSLWAAVRGTPRDTAEALATARGHRALLSAILAKSPLGLAGGAGFVCLNLLAEQARPFGAAALSLGLLQAVRGVGTGAGPLMAARLVAGGADPRRLLHVAAAVMLTSVATLAVARAPWALALAALGWGLGTGTNWVMAHAAMQRHASDAEIGRLAALDELLVTLAMCLGAVVAALLADASGVPAAALAGAALGVVGLATVRVVVAAAPPPA